jgi:quercetin dioxygenase-like cupin family protein
MHRVTARLVAAVRFTLVAGLLVAGSTTTLAAQATHTALTWGPAPAVFPAGARMAVVSGDPSAAAPFVVRLSLPNKYRIPPHFHPTDETVTVRSGNLIVGMGDSIDVAKSQRAKPGTTKTIPATMHHWAMARGRTVIQVAAMGPFQMTYVNASDDPQRTASRP